MATLRKDAALRPTMKEVAALAGVSLKTVSRVVNDESGVRPELIAQVQQAIQLLGYRRDVTASTLRRADRLSSSIGVIFEDVANPFHSSVHRGVEDVARARGVLTFAGSADEDPERERELAAAFSARRVDGLVVVPAGADQTYLLREREAGVALVFVDRPPRFLDADAVLSDNRAGAEAAVSHLIAHGHRRIAHLGDRERIYTAAERLTGYRQALARHGITYDDSLVVLGLDDPERAAAVVGELMRRDDPPTALFTSQNLITVAALRTLRRLGLHRSVAMVGFDDVELADALEPGLTVVAQDPVALGRIAAELLFRRLDGYDGPSERVVLPTTLIARGSGELRP